MKCNNCGTEFSEGIFCPECGSKVETESKNESGCMTERDTVALQEQKKESNNPVKNEAVFCKKCGGQIDNGLKYCPYCGALFVPGAEHGSENNYAGKEPVIKKWMIAVPVSILVIVLVIIGFTDRTVLNPEEVEDDKFTAEQGRHMGEDTDSVVVMENVEPDDLEEASENETDMGEDLDKTDPLLKDENIDDTAENEESTEEDLHYEKWVGEYIRDVGPCSGISIWSIDETGVLFAAGIGGSGYLSYRDLRDCNAKWISDTVAVYYDEYGDKIELFFEEDNKFAVLEEKRNPDGILLLTGVYEKEDGLDLNDYGFVLKDSDRRNITEKDLENLGSLECKIARNEIYARHGRMFNDEQLQNYFDSCDWYRGEIPAESFDLDLLNDIERENADLISTYEEKMGYK